MRYPDWKPDTCGGCDMAFIEAMHQNEPDITYQVSDWKDSSDISL